MAALKRPRKAKPQAEEKANPLDELASLFPKPSTVTVNGVAMNARELTVRELGGVIHHIGPIVGALSGGRTPHEIAADCYDGAVAFTAAATGMQPDQFDALPASVGLALFECALGANASFFAMAVTRAMHAQRAVQMTADRLGAGPTPSNTSSAAAAATPPTFQ